MTLYRRLLLLCLMLMLSVSPLWAAEYDDEMEDALDLMRAEGAVFDIRANCTIPKGTTKNCIASCRNPWHGGKVGATSTGAQGSYTFDKLYMKNDAQVLASTQATNGWKVRVKMNRYAASMSVFMTCLE